MWMLQNHFSQNNEISKDLFEMCMLIWLSHLIEQLLPVGLQQDQCKEEVRLGCEAGLFGRARFFLSSYDFADIALTIIVPANLAAFPPAILSSRNKSLYYFLISNSFLNSFFSVEQN